METEDDVDASGNGKPKSNSEIKVYERSHAELQNVVAESTPTTSNVNGQ